ncbi:peroxynitrite isomerase THAP4-like [Cardiocondyla obscurior]|uniref:peroxynitrite isomerase THAP4-like n=1 Tax=Cardiocondyla obscurior TaxID=286306 RepID=UPI003965740B
MVGCCAEFCNNSSTKGYTMKVFPRNAEYRAIWAKNVGRKDWTPTNNMYLCEIYFATNMWQQRLDRKKKLKKNAVSTIFGFFLKKKNLINNNSNNLLIECYVRIRNIF